MSAAGQRAHTGRRIIASSIDFVLVPLVSFLVMLVSGAMETADAYAGNQIWLRGIGLGVAGYLLINGWLLHRRGQTVGKMVMGIMIVDAQSGEKAAWWRLIAIRALFFPLLYLPLLYSIVGLWALLPLLDQAFALRRDRRCLHDLAAGTAVVTRLKTQHA
ncbi:MAG: RDD family protein [Pseudomonadales bacterium]|nr:RDD family protein [Pseudomonadales bacterium]